MVFFNDETAQVRLCSFDIIWQETNTLQSGACAHMHQSSCMGNCFLLQKILQRVPVQIKFGVCYFGGTSKNRVFPHHLLFCVKKSNSFCQIFAHRTGSLESRQSSCFKSPTDRLLNLISCDHMLYSLLSLVQLLTILFHHSPLVFSKTFKHFLS